METPQNKLMNEVDPDIHTGTKLLNLRGKVGVGTWVGGERWAKEFICIYP